jgi:uroporphyrinogen decarboxylase
MPHHIVQGEVFLCPFRCDGEEFFMSNRQLVFDVLNNKPADRVPVGFWFHFAQGDEFTQGLANPAVVKKNIDGHKKYFKDFKPDFVKLMSDGFFEYPSKIITDAKSAKDLYELEPVGKDAPWIKAQAKLVQSQTALFNNEVYSFYNIFGPATSFKLRFGADGDKKLASFIKEDKDAVAHALNVIAQDLGSLASAVIDAGADGIYLSVQNIQDKRVTSDLYRRIIKPAELAVLVAAEAAGGTNILHVCGYEGARNDLSLYADYPAKAVNWAVTVEKVSLEEGKKLFGGRTVIGGFNNTAKGILYKGTKQEIQAETKRLLKGAGRRGVILGADCTVPPDIPLEHLEWVREAAK